ncbi:MAG: recombinase RecA [Candidatus Omnitrophica bacterium]|nr:recombinase RecA [Candidatus Omnitrophota bacterium]
MTAIIERTLSVKPKSKEKESESKIKEAEPKEGEARSAEKVKALELALAQIEKQFGKGAIMKLGSQIISDVPALPTGSLSLDMAIGIGGIPRGRVVEIFGPESSGKTTLTLSLIAETQARGGVAAFIDAEHAFDPGYAKKIGVNNDELLISQPDTGEEALEIAEMLVRSNAVDVIVIDSVAALVPKVEIEGEMGQAHVGLQARLMSQALRKLTGPISKSKTALVFINQLREKIGVMFGCLNYSSRITLADGRSEKIGKIVNQKAPGKVLSYDPETGTIRPHSIAQWFRNGTADRFLQLTVYRPGGNGRAQLACTEDHPILTPRGWRRAKRLEPGDLVMVAIPHRLSDFQNQIIMGSVLGDGHLARNPQQPQSQGVRFRMGHGPKQETYAGWKASLFENIPTTLYRNSKGGLGIDLTPLPELLPLQREIYRGSQKHLPGRFLKQLTPLALSIWYMDDGNLAIRNKAGTAGRSTICVEAIEPESRQRLAARLREGWGVDVKLVLQGKRRKAVLVFPKHGTEQFHQLVAPYVHPSMEYKLLPQYRGQFHVKPVFQSTVLKPLPMPVVDVHEKPMTRSMHRFDIEVDGTHNFLADGVIAHNSPETTPGGRALKFYSSVRLDIRRIEHIKRGDEVIGSHVRVRVVKNKVAPPFRQAEFDIMWDEGISKSGDLIDVGTQTGVLQKSGTWLTYGEVKLGQGRENARAFLKENPKLMLELESKLREEVKSVSPVAAVSRSVSARDGQLVGR